MMLSRLRLGAATGAAFLLGAAAAPTAAQEPVPLGFAVPDDVHFYVHGMTSQTPDPGWMAFERAVGQLVSSRVHEDVLDLVTLDMSKRQRQEFRATVDTVLGAFGHVDWSLLFANEIVFAERIVLPMPEYIYLFRVPADRADEQVLGMRRMLGDLVRLIGEGKAAVRDVERADVGTMTTLELEGAPTLLAFSRVEDVLLVSTSPRMLGASMRRIAERNGKGSLVASERFRASVQHLPAPTQSVMYLDVAGLHGFLSQALRLAMAGASGDPDASRALDVVTSVVEELDVVDHLMLSTTSDGTTVETTVLTRMQPDYADMRIAKVFSDREPWQNWYRYVPEDATSFWFDPGFDPAALLDFGVAMAEQAMVVEPGTEGPPALRDGRLARLRNHLDRISGEMAAASFPQAGPDGCATGESVLVVRLDEPEGVSQFLNDTLQQVCGFLESRGQSATVWSRGDMHVLELGAFPWMHPTVGVHEGMLYFATSPAAIHKITSVARGAEAGIRGRERYARLGLEAPDTVMSLAYGEVDAPAIGFPDLVSAVGFGLSMFPEEKDTKPVLILGRILTKLAPALRELTHGYTWGQQSLPSPEPGVFLGRSVYRYSNGT